MVITLLQHIAEMSTACCKTYHHFLNFNQGPYVQYMQTLAVYYIDNFIRH